MKYRALGTLNWEVSALGFGCMRLPSKGIFRSVDWEESIKLIRYGIDQGINYIDTAWMYHLGASEKIIGNALRDGYREKVFLVTKLPTFMVRKTEDFDTYLTKQLKRLQTDYLDAYLFHLLNRSQFLKLEKFDLIDKMEEAKEHGYMTDSFPSVTSMVSA